MRFTYDEAVDAMAVELAPGAKSKRTRRVARDVNIDLDARGRLISVEVLNASEHYGARALAAMDSPERLLTLTEAAEESGLAAATLRKQIHNGRLYGIKRGRDWMVAEHTLWSYLETRDPRGRRAPTEKSRGRGAARSS
ncbi:MAG: DUF2283 domain-containing protein [Gemmatimonadetes bacterium]|nr:DUF2283 domain-containing protein [Gemmatimonadota bacterium]